MALKSSLLWFRRNWRNTSSRFFTSCGPWTIRADCCGGNKSQSLSARGCAPPVLTQTFPSAHTVPQRLSAQSCAP